MKKIVVAMSGGVDSAVAAKILKDQGYEVIGIFMRNWDSMLNNDILGNPHKNILICDQEQDWKDVKKIGQQLDIKIERVDFIKEYWDKVFQDLIKNYKMGKTPNPDVLCNRYIKFGCFQKYVFEKYQNIDFLATGHYADQENGLLKTPTDKNKDQTYFLSQIKKEVLKKIIFPLAKLKKQEVRAIAAKNKFIVAHKKDSTGICFIGKRNFSKFLQNYIDSQPGEIIDITNKQVVGKHLGIMYYTIGQRKGLHLGGMNKPYYVVGYNIAKKIIYVASENNDKFLLSDAALIKKINWLSNEKYEQTSLYVKFRYRTPAVKCQIKWIKNKNLKVYYSQKFKAVTPGQHAVFYLNDYCLGGGIIEKVYENGVLKDIFNL